QYSLSLSTVMGVTSARGSTAIGVTLVGSSTVMGVTSARGSTAIGVTSVGSSTAIGVTSVGSSTVMGITSVGKPSKLVLHGMILTCSPFLPGNPDRPWIPESP
uniref:Uncharacterized protein n=1 Tax=Oncorhynchus kisutch TaxID=8019 RepID=A0A8C7M3I2_ONCKI